MYYNTNMKNKLLLNNEYLNDISKLQFAVDYVKSTDFSIIADGRLEFDRGIWANVQTYQTKEDALFEAHKKFIDVQYLISGYENIGVTDYKKCLENVPYDIEKDIEFLTADDFIDVEMNQGDFLILYPSDAHKPSITRANQPSNVRKIVIKVPID